MSVTAPEATPALHNYQVEGIEFLRARERALLFDEPGMGKSAQLARSATGRTLVIAPAKILNAGVWDDQLQMWAPDLDAYEVAYSGLTKRIKTGTNASATRPLPMPAADALALKWDTFICDEAHYLKGRGTTWTKAFLKVLARNPDARVLLGSGTPIPNFADELFVPLQILHPDLAYGGGELGSYWRWVAAEFKTWDAPWGAKQVTYLKGCNKRCDADPDCPHWKAFHDHWLAGVAIGRRWGEVDLPPITEQVIHVPMTTAQRKAYKELKKQYTTELESGLELTAWHGGPQTSLLRRVCTGLELLDPTTQGSGKLGYLAEILPGRPNPTLVAAHHRSAVREVLRLCAKLKLKAIGYTGATPKSQVREIVRGFQRGEFAVMAGTLDYLKEGITLTQADTVVFLEESWVPSTNEGVLRRLARLGAQRPIHVIRLLSKDSLDSRIHTTMQRKSDRAMKALRPQELAALL